MFPDFERGVIDGGYGRINNAGDEVIIKAHDTKVLGYPYPDFFQILKDTDSHIVIGAENRIRGLRKRK